ncbi:uncharacterized protein PV07_11986 [Cladophialophora immunda]|uniref:Uncharacterized protein n=1 Tax=Cladophialophora immunda TaxID=569365 RepID=A0A0D1Z838_9EURO|nr:uncharacterized protein PV07_11986 [Cladophialophora immunda]KIW23816.1 hypothetical protein PV07_11986 [Cladophialophora immunda]
MCNTVIPGRYCECGKILEIFTSYVEECVVITQDAEKQPGDCGEMNEMRVPVDWETCPGGCSSSGSPAMESTPGPSPEADDHRIKAETSREDTPVATPDSSTCSHQSPASTPVAEGENLSDENENEAERPAVSPAFTPQDVPDLLSKLIRTLEGMSVALQDIKSQVDHIQRTPGVGGGGNSNQGGGRVIVVETPTNIENVVKLVLRSQYAAKGE